MSGNGNGKTSAAIIEAHKRVEEAQRQLRDLDAKLAGWQIKLNEAEQVVAQLQTARDDAEQGIVDERPGAVAKIRQLDADLTVASARVSGLRTKVAFLQQERPPLDAAYQQAAVKLTQLIEEEQFTTLEEELSKARFHLAQSQEQTKQREKVVNELADRLRVLSAQRREAQQAETQRASREKFMRDNNQFVTMDKARTHVRSGF